MSYTEILLLAFALAADAFTVATAIGLRHNSARQVFRTSFHFGLFQSLMSLAGAIAGSLFLRRFAWIDHWVAFTLLAVVGGRMIHGGVSNEEHRIEADPTRGFALIGLSTAVSIDALAAGVGLAATDASLPFAIPMIGTVSATASLAGMRLARWIGMRFGKRCGVVAGIVLVAIGANILREHLL